MIRTTVRSVLCIAHRDPRNGGLHGHTYEVWARFPGDIGRDARDLQAELENALTRWDHTEVESLSGEELAILIGDALDRLGCDHVRLERNPEGIIAEWWA